MDRRVLLGAGVAVVAVAAFFGLRGVTNQQAGRVLDTSLEQLTAQLPPGTTVTHGATEVNPLTQGLTVHDVVMTLPDHSMLAADTVTLAGVNPLALRDVFDVAAYPDGKPAWTERRLLVGSATIENLRRDDGKRVVTLAHVALQNLSGHPFKEPPSAAYRRSQGFGVEAALDFKVDDITATGLVASTPGPEGNNSAIGSLRIDHYDGGKLGAFVLRDITIDTRVPGNPKPALIKLASMEVRALDVGGVLRTAASGGQVNSAAFSYARIGLAGLDVQITKGPKFSLQDVHVDLQPQGGGGGGGDGARDSKLTLTALRLDLGDSPVPPSGDAAIEAFGMRAITLDITGASHTVSGGVSDVTEDFMFHDLGTLHLKAAFSGFVQPLQQDPKAAVDALLNTSLDRGKIEWDDASLTDRLFKVAAVQMHSTPEAARAQMALPLVALGVLVPDQPDIVDQVSGFLKDPHRLTVTLNPPEKATFGEIGRAPANLRAHLLGLHVTADKGP